MATLAPRNRQFAGNSSPGDAQDGDLADAASKTVLRGYAPSSSQAGTGLSGCPVPVQRLPPRVVERLVRTRLTRWPHPPVDREVTAHGTELPTVGDRCHRGDVLSLPGCEMSIGSAPR